MMHITNLSWELIPQEIWFNIFENLPLKNQVSLACTCIKLYEFSLDYFLGNTEARAQLYFEENLPLPDPLAQSMRSLRLFVEDIKEQTTEKSIYLKEQIIRMRSLKKLIIEEDYQRKNLFYTPFYMK